MAALKLAESGRFGFSWSNAIPRRSFAEDMSTMTRARAVEQAPAARRPPPRSPSSAGCSAAVAAAASGASSSGAAAALLFGLRRRRRRGLVGRRRAPSAAATVLRHVGVFEPLELVAPVPVR